MLEQIFYWLGFFIAAIFLAVAFIVALSSVTILLICTPVFLGALVVGFLLLG